MNESRRQFLKLGAGLAGVGATTGLAGCSQIPLLGGGGTGPAFYKNWMYAPGTFVDDQEHYRFSAYRPANWAQNEDSFDSNYYDSVSGRVESKYEATGLDFGDINRYINLAGGVASVATGSYKKEDVVGELDDSSGYEEQEQTDSGYTIFVNTGNRTAFGVGSDAIVRLNRLPQSGGGGAGVQLNAPSSSEAQQDARSISYGETITGTIDNNDPTGTDRRGTHEPITFTGSEGDVVTITMAGTDDTYLQLLDPSGQMVTENDDGYSGLNSQIQRYTLQTSGEYTIVATSFSSGATFSYRLQLKLIFSPSAFPENIKTIVGTQSGDTSLYADEVDPASDLFSTLGGGDFVSGRTMEAVDSGSPEQGRFENMVGRGTNVIVNGKTSNFRTVVLYEEKGDFDKGDIEDWTDEAAQFDNVDNIKISQSGRAGVVTGKIDTDDLDS